MRQDGETRDRVSFGLVAFYNLRDESVLKRERSVRIMPLCGDTRVSIIDWDLRLQRSALQAAGCDVIPAELASGSRKRDPAHFSRVISFSCCERAGRCAP